MALHQKRMLAFINHFVIKTVQFLNNFANECETKLIDYEIKMQKIEASLKILETKLSSIPENADLQVKGNAAEVPGVQELGPEQTSPTVESNNTDSDESPAKAPNPTEPVSEPIRRDPMYDRFFKMIQVGVPVPAVKLKMIGEGLDPSMID